MLFARPLSCVDSQVDYTIPVARADRIARIYEAGVRSIFGVPGDFNLTLLDHVDYVPGLNWGMDIRLSIKETGC